MTDFRVNGLSDLLKYMDALPVKFERNIARGGLRAGAKIIKEAAASRVPVGPTSSENARIYGGYMGALRDSIRVSTKARGGRVTASIIAGGKLKSGADVYYARFVEYGTKPHYITAKDGSALAFGGRFYRAIHHPGSRAANSGLGFMRNAADTQAGASVVAVGNYIQKRLSTKYGIDASDVEVEAE